LLKEEQVQSEKGSLKGCLILKKHPNLNAESLFGKGLFTIQDQASQLISHLVGIKDGITIVDAAAGPGGKLTHMREMSNDTVKIIAVEKSVSQMERARETAKRLGCDEQIDWVFKDFMEFRPEKPVDRVLLDAPCTGLGVLRRHPEGKWHKSEAGIKDLAKQQRLMIEHALEMLKPGGEMIYSVCSFELDETEAQAKWIKETFGTKVELVSPVSRLPDYFKRYVTRDNVLMIYAGNQDDMDGFGAFIVKWKGDKP
jgi:16S rRNA (cytosine967-C5)-methyltransferase